MLRSHLRNGCSVSLFVVLLVALTGNSLAQEPKLPPGEELPPPKRVQKPEALVPPPQSTPSLLPQQTSPLDLDTALRLAGVRNPEILLARERVALAVAVHQEAAVKFLPSINVGTNVDTHSGTLQQSNGTIAEINRGAMYLGLGANAVAAGTVSVPGLVVSGNVAAGIYAALVTRQVVRQRQFASLAVRNDMLLRVTAAYMELLRAEGHLAVGLETRRKAAEVARITAAYVKAGQGRQADADRAATTFDLWDNRVVQFEGDVLTASAKLAQVLDLDPSVRLQPTDAWVVPAPVVPDPIPLKELLVIALRQRPELAQRRAAIDAAFLTLQGAKLLPFSPNVTLGYSAGTFGGGSNVVAAGVSDPLTGAFVQQNRFGNFADRQDVDAVVYWTAQNLGLGNVALIRIARSNLRSQDLRLVQTLDMIGQQVAAAYAATHARFAQIATTEKSVQTSKNGYEEDMLRIRQGQGLPIELLDSLRLLGESRLTYLDAIVDYNEAQFALYVALGQPPANTLARPLPAALVPPPTPPAPEAVHAR
jgi:outer membrane protein TolC